MRTISIAVLAMVTASPGFAGTPEQLASQRERILRSMPTNSDKRCLGIAVVAEALLDGRKVNHSAGEEVGQLAQRIYQHTRTGRPLSYGAYVTIDQAEVPTDSTTAIDRLSTLVADHYKRDYLSSLNSRKGRRQLSEAQRSYVLTLTQLDRILNVDNDRLDVFFGEGTRRYPDGTIGETHHAFLIGKSNSGELFVYDPNDPGSPLPCQLEETNRGATIQWSCQYQNDLCRTTQRYHIVHKDIFFRIALGD